MATLPLQPLGTASDGSVTTYLFQAVNNVLVTSTDASGLLTTLTVPSPTPRTIVASASGWVESFTDADISCGLLNSGFGECLIGTTVANSGVPTPEIFQVSRATSLSSATPTITFPPSSSISGVPLSSDPTDAATFSGKSTPTPVGAIVGGIMGGCAALVIVGLIFFVFWQRRKNSHIEEAWPLPVMPFNAAPQVEAAVTSPGVSSPRKRRPEDFFQPPQDTTSFVHPATASSNSEAPEYRIGEIVERLRRLEARGCIYEEPLPSYNAV
ncbi:hypothetical protein B0H11DRAFT_1947843 [Mycena galericulata]|nr:hypothetical protein B0H11DRAFT_1947843 [Mycena galericulata]